MFIKPKEGYVVLDPYTMEPLPAEGADKPDHDGYWQRRLRDGDVEMAQPPVMPTPIPAADLEGPMQDRPAG